MKTKTNTNTKPERLYSPDHLQGRAGGLSSLAWRDGVAAVWFGKAKNAS
jgi:hypothetical protein